MSDRTLGARQQVSQIPPGLVDGWNPPPPPVKMCPTSNLIQGLGLDGTVVIDLKHDSCQLLKWRNGEVKAQDRD
jgi:hypothetical protein